MSQFKKSDDLQEKLEELRGKEKEDRAKRTALKFNLPYLDLAARPIDSQALGIIEENAARSAQFAVFQKEGEKDLKVAVLNPRTPAIQKIIAELKKKGFNLSLFIVSQKSLEKAFDFLGCASRASDDVDHVR